ncbi:hypothetical protein BGX34_005230 [Mortierella sp. NVP85]|nr:hypothetical protein BGX34_005230 [Mortierella sp. NVP85]
MFHGQELSVQRRMFQSANEGEGQQGLIKERRKLASAKKEQAEVEGNDAGSMDEEASGSTSIVPVEPSIMDPKEAEAGPQEGGGKGETSGFWAFKETHWINDQHDAEDNEAEEFSASSIKA